MKYKRETVASLFIMVYTSLLSYYAYSSFTVNDSLVRFAYASFLVFVIAFSTLLTFYQLVCCGDGKNESCSEGGGL